jgi:hypothetical protein
MNGLLPHEVRAGARTRGGRPRSWPLVGLLVLGSLGTFATRLASAAAPDASARPATAADCTSLLHQFDVAWSAHRDDPRAAGARHSRDLGDVSCSQRHYADGVRLIRRALHDIGVKPVKIAPAAPGH